MDLNLVPGMTYTTRMLVDKARSIAFMGEELRVYSTPSMILDVENVCKDFIQERLPDDSSSVGAHVEWDHLGPTLVGMWVDISIKVTSVEGRKVSFDAEVRDALDLVGVGKHARVVINLARQNERLTAKAAKAQHVESGR